MSSSQLRVAFWPLDSFALALLYAGPTWKASLVPCHKECWPAGASALLWPLIFGTRPEEKSPLLGDTHMYIYSFLCTVLCSAWVLGTQLLEPPSLFPLQRAFSLTVLRGLGGGWKHLLHAGPEFSCHSATRDPSPTFPSSDVPIPVSVFCRSHWLHHTALHATPCSGRGLSGGTESVSTCSGVRWRLRERGVSALVAWQGSPPRSPVHTPIRRRG